jgi:hypothetical protein
MDKVNQFGNNVPIGLSPKSPTPLSSVGAADDTVLVNNDGISADVATPHTETPTEVTVADPPSKATAIETQAAGALPLTDSEAPINVDNAMEFKDAEDKLDAAPETGRNDNIGIIDNSAEILAAIVEVEATTAKESKRSAKTSTHITVGKSAALRSMSETMSTMLTKGKMTSIFVASAGVIAMIALFARKWLSTSSAVQTTEPLESTHLLH